LFQIYQAFASANETAAMARAYAEGIGWGDAKQMLFERLDREIAPMREHYQSLIDNPAQMDKILLAGADKARQLATPFMRDLRHAVGLRALSLGQVASVAKEAKTALPSFKQYREKDGLFYFKLVDAKGLSLLQSRGFASPKEAGQAISRLQNEGVEGLRSLDSWLEPVAPDSWATVVANLQLFDQTHQNLSK
jgi:tryptophanyl-tRNA synthetase